MSRPALALTFALLATPALAATSGQDTAAAGKVLDRFHAAAAASDFDGYFSLFAPQAVFIGTDASERWTLKEFEAYTKPVFAAHKGWVYTPRERHLAITQDPCRCVVWFDEILDSKSYGTSRGTGVLVKQKGRWKIAQYALTFPIPNDLAKDMTDRIKAYEAGKK